MDQSKQIHTGPPIPPRSAPAPPARFSSKIPGPPPPVFSVSSPAEPNREPTRPRRRNKRWDRENRICPSHRDTPVRMPVPAELLHVRSRPFSNRLPRERVENPNMCAPPCAYWASARRSDRRQCETRFVRANRIRSAAPHSAATRASRAAICRFARVFFRCPLVFPE